MKKIFLAIVVFIVASTSMNAQVAKGNSSFEYRGGSFYQNGEKLTPEQLCATIGQQAYEDSYKPGKGMRIAGISMLSAGGAATALGAGMYISALIGRDKSAGQAIGDVAIAAVGVTFAIPGIVVAAAGGVLLGVGNKKLKNIVPASSGTGLALAF